MWSVISLSRPQQVSKTDKQPRFHGSETHVCLDFLPFSSSDTEIWKHKPFAIVGREEFKSLLGLWGPVYQRDWESLANWHQSDSAQLVPPLEPLRQPAAAEEKLEPAEIVAGPAGAAAASPDTEMAVSSATGVKRSAESAGLKEREEEEGEGGAGTDKAKKQKDEE
jgi:hypothetical protein